MKSCPTCNRTYSDETLIFCLDDGATLSAPHEPPETRRMPAPRRTDPAPTEAASKPTGSAPSLPPTIPSPQPPFYAGEQARQAPEKPDKRTGLMLILAALLGVVLALGIIVGFMWLRKGKALDESKIPNANEVPTRTPPAAGSGEGVSNISIEYDTDRPGADYKDYDLPQPRYELCRDACGGDAKCRAYTYVKPGVQGLKARCWLKSSVPAGGSSNCCISGVKH